jgi:phage gp46-like protein
MTDIAMVFDFTRGVFDYAMDGPQLAQDNGLSTAIILSWFTDARAQSYAELPQNQPGPFGLNKSTGGDLRGWWGDFMTAAVVNLLPGQSYPKPAFRLGSRFWLYKRRKMTAGLPAEVQADAYDALGWMKTIGVATSMNFSAFAVGNQTILIRGKIILANGQSVALLLPVVVGGGSWPLPEAVSSGQYGAIGVTVLD